MSLKMRERLEQQYCMQFCHKLGDTQAETIQQNSAGDDAVGGTEIKKWSTALKMAECRRTVTSVLGDRQ
jgi:hypothetical protein